MESSAANGAKLAILLSMRRTIVIGCLSLALNVVARADVLHLANGKAIQGDLLAYTGEAFAVAKEDGAVIEVLATNVVGADFSKGSLPAVVELPEKKPLTGKIWLISRDTVNLENAKGETLRVPLAEVSKITFNATAPPVQPTPSRPAEAKPKAQESKAPPFNAKLDSAKIQLIARGNHVDVAQHCVTGKVTVVDFYAEWCGPCRELSPILEARVKSDPDLVLRKIDIVNWDSAVSQQFKLKVVPFVQVYDRTGQKVGEIAGFNANQFDDFIQAAKNPLPAWRNWPVVRWLF